MESFENTMEIKVSSKNQLIENVELRKFVQFKIGKNDICEKDLDSIDEIVLDSENIVGQHNPVNFEEIKLFKNLQKISIRNLGVSLEQWGNIEHIKEFEFINCEVRGTDKLKNANTLFFVNSEIENFDFLKECKKLEKLVIKNVKDFSLEKINFPLPITYLSLRGIENLELNLLLNYENLNILSVDRDEVKNWQNELITLKNNGIKILFNDIIYEY